MRAEAGYLDFSLKIYSALGKTIQECRDITDAVDFSNGLAFYNQGMVQMLQDNFGRGVALIQLAWEEDKELVHHGEAEKRLEEWSSEFCSLILDLFRDDQHFNKMEPTNILSRLGNEKYRLMAIVIDHNTRLKDWRSLAIKDAAETNILRICKLTEYYLKTKLPRSDELPAMIEFAFSKNKKLFSWFKKWAKWKGAKGATSYRYPTDDSKIIDILDSPDDSVLKSFKLICLLRNFTAHIYNERSILFRRYEDCFKTCLKALMYTINYVS